MLSLMGKKLMRLMSVTQPITISSVNSSSMLQITELAKYQTRNTLKQRVDARWTVEIMSATAAKSLEHPPTKTLSTS